MKVLSYKYIAPGSDGVVEGLDHTTYTTTGYMELVGAYIKSLKIQGNVAFLYIGGATLPASESRITEKKQEYRVEVLPSGLVIRELSAFMMHKWIGMIPNNQLITYANINANTCASSMYSLYEAERLLDSGFDEVIILGEEKTSYNTLRLFDEMGIGIKVGEGFAVMHLGKGDGISGCKWSYEYNRNPFGTTQSGYKRVDSKCDIVKPHGTGTDNNEQAELVLTEGREQVRYKDFIGHTQGVSGLLEVCLVLDNDSIVGDVLCVSSGLGGFYGSCIVHKE